MTTAVQEFGPRPAILEHSAALPLFVMLRYTTDTDRFTDHIDNHLAWMGEQERDGQVVMSGPTSSGGSAAIQGLTILRCADLIEAERFARADPLVRSGCVRYELCAWTAYEGSFRLTLTLSDSRIVFD